MGGTEVAPHLPHRGSCRMEEEPMKTRLDRLRPMVAIGSVALFVYLLRRTGFEGF